MLDTIGLTINRLWAILEADTVADVGWVNYFRPGNRIKVLGNASPYPPKPVRQSADFGEVIITVNGWGGNAFVPSGPRGPMVTFCNAAGTPGAYFDLVCKREYLLKTTFDELRYENADAALARAEFLFTAAGSKLGLPTWCESWSYAGRRAWERPRSITDSSPGRPSVVDYFTISVNYRIPSTVLLAS